MKMLPKSFYRGEDVVTIARNLLGKRLCTNFNGKFSSAIITETEAYAGITDKASHAYGGKFTERTKVMYEEGGTAYVYLCYGIHHLFNIVTNRKGIPHAVLVRGVFPEQGTDLMMKRRGKNKIDKNFSSGPGTVSQALGIHVRHSGLSLVENQIWLEKTKISFEEKDIFIGPRVGVEYAGKDAKLPYRFRVSAEVMYDILR